MCKSLEFGKKEKHFYRKTEFLGTSFDILHAQFRRSFFSTLIRDGAVFLEVKSSNKIETDQYLKKRFL